MDTFKKLLYIFNRKQKVSILGLGILIIIGALLELLGITAILPFVNVWFFPSWITTPVPVFFYRSFPGHKKAW